MNAFMSLYVFTFNFPTGTRSCWELEAARAHEMRNEDFLLLPWIMCRFECATYVGTSSCRLARFEIFAPNFPTKAIFVGNEI